MYGLKRDINLFISVALVLSMANTLVLTGCTTHTSKKERKKITVETTIVEKTITKPAHTYIGRINDAGSISLSFPLGGRITEVCVKNGQQVSEGQILVKADDTQALASLATAEAKLQQAQDGYKRVMEVYKEGAVTEVKMVEVETQLKQAEALVTGLRRQADDYTLRAPFAGTINGLSAIAGRQMIPAEQVLTLLSINKMEAVFSVSENDITNIKNGQKAKISIPALGKTYNAIITELNLIANPISHTYDVHATITDKTNAEVLTNMVAKVTINAQDLIGFEIPTSAVEYRDGKLSVWVVNDSCTTKRYITVGKYTNDGILVTDGLAEGDHVVIKGVQKLYEGAGINEKQP